MSRILFHYPGPFYDRLDTGEKRRPVMMAQAFEAIGFEVVRFVGTRPERTRQWPEIRELLPTCDFLYSENSTMPLGLTGPRHLPTFSPVDYRLFRAAKAAGVPNGVFFRDVYWAFDSFREEHGRLKTAVASYFYRSEVRLYHQCCTRIFVPSHEYGAMLPGVPPGQLMPLPPGCQFIERSPVAASDRLRLVYVGAVQPPIYDISPLLDAMRQLMDLPVELTISTRPESWTSIEATTQLPPNTRVVHYEKEQLAELLAASDISLICFAPDPYRRIAVPLKLYEAIGFGLPVIATGPTAVGRLVREYGIGWETKPEDVADQLRHLASKPEEFHAKRRQALAIREEHTWEARARQAAEALCRR